MTSSGWYPAKSSQNVRPSALLADSECGCLCGELGVRAQHRVGVRKGRENTTLSEHIVAILVRSTQTARTHAQPKRSHQHIPKLPGPHGPLNCFLSEQRTREQAVLKFN